MDVVPIIKSAILSTRSDAIIAADKEGTIIFWNPGAERVFGYSTAEAVGRSLDIIIPMRLRKRHWDGYRQVVKTGKGHYGHGDVLAVPGIGKDGSQISLEFTIIPMCGGDRELIGFVAIMRDVTKRFEETKALKRKSRQGLINS